MTESLTKKEEITSEIAKPNAGSKGNKEIAAADNPELEELQKKADEKTAADQKATTESGLELKPNLNDKETDLLGRHGDKLVSNTQNAGEAVSWIHSKISPPEKKEPISTDDQSVLDKIQDFIKRIFNSGTSAVISAIVSIGQPIFGAIQNGLLAKTKWNQWSVLENTVYKNKEKREKNPEAPAEAGYGLSKVWKGFYRAISEVFLKVSDFMANLLILIPGANAIGVIWKLVNKIITKVKGLLGSAKAVWQWFNGEKKISNSNELLEKAIKGDPASLQLIFDLKLGSIFGSGNGTLDWLTGIMGKGAADFISTKTGISAEAGERIIDLANKTGGPSDTKELFAYLQVIDKKESSKKIILDELKEMMTGVGT
jgi:hypothetical protein